MLQERDMKENYDVKNLNPKRNPYAKELKKQITINIEMRTIEYFKELAKETGIPYQTLINMYLTDCVNNKRKLEMTWK